MRTTEVLNNQRLVVSLPFESTAQSLCDTVRFPPNLRPLTHRSVVASINSVTLDVLIAAEAVPESFYMTLDLLYQYHAAAENLILVGLTGVKQP